MQLSSSGTPPRRGDLDSLRPPAHGLGPLRPRARGIVPSRPRTHGLPAAILAVGLAWLAATTAARAQSDIRQVNVQTFEPTTSLWGTITLDSSVPLRHLQAYGYLGLAYSMDPLRARQGGETVARYVANHLVMDAVAALGLWGYLELGVHFPAALYQDDRGDPAVLGAAGDLSVAAPGDLRIVPRVRFWRPVTGTGFGLAVAPAFTVRSGFSDANAGERFLTFEPRLVADYRFQQGTLITLNVGFRVRKPVEVSNLRVGHELFYGLGAEVPVYRLNLSLLAEIIGAVGLSDAARDGDPAIDEEEAPLEAVLGVRYRFPMGLVVTAGGAAGLTSGWGTPRFRVFAGVGFTFNGAYLPGDDDPDGDGISGLADRCPNQAEDRDGFRDDDGCPDPDNDQDGVCDDNPEIQRRLGEFRDLCVGRDRCPDRKETINGVEDEDGCPDQGKAPIQVVGDRILMLENIYFGTGSVSIQPRSHKVLRTLAAVLRSRPDIRKVVVEGHTDERGSARANLRLSRRRARTVRRFLIKRGIAPSRLVAKGYGESRPVAKGCRRLKNQAERKACLHKNRRVVFRVLKQD